MDINRVKNSLRGLTEHRKEDGRVWITGTLENTFKVSILEQGVSLKGSLAKFYMGDNFHTLTRADSARAIEKMADELGLPVGQAKVSRIDFAENLLMEYKPEAYYPYLGECRDYKRLTQPHSVYWCNGNRTKLIYNKVAEVKDKKGVLPEVWRGQNVLRYEMRYIRKLSKQLQRPEITAITLSDEKFHMNLVERYVAEYEAIHKLKSIKLNFTDMNSPKDFWEQMVLQGIEHIGGQRRAMEIVEEMRARGTYSRSEYYSRLKGRIKEICKTPEMTTTSELITELDEKVRDVSRNCR